MAAQPQRDYLEVNPAGIPQELKARTQWVAWRAAWKTDRWTKIPVDTHTGGEGSSTNPATWNSYAGALAYADKRGVPGIGYVFSPDDPYAGIDIDKCRNPQDGTLSTLATTLLGELDGYAEVSPSGTGIKIFVRGTVPHGKGRRSIRHGVEFYDQARFFTVTGHILPDAHAEPPERQAALSALHARFFPVAPVGDDTPPPRQSAPPPDDQALIDRAHRAKNGLGFAHLWRGDTSGHHGDESSADLALCNMLAFWAGPDPARIDRLFRASGLYRTKWERPDYRERTIGKALEGRAEFYDWAERGDSGASFRIVGDDESPETEGGAPSTNPNDYELTDTGNGELYATLYDGQYRHDHRRDRWYRWDGHGWRADSDRYARLATREIARLRARAAAEQEDEKARKHALAWARESASRARRSAILDLARDQPNMVADGTDWDTDPFLLGVANGVIDLRTGALHPGHPLDRVTLRAPIVYDPHATASRFERVIAEIFAGDTELVGWVRRMIGYSLTGAIGEHAFVVCYGVGGNGKSTLFTLLSTLLGEYAGTLNFSALAQNKFEAHPTELAALVGKRFVTASEINEGQQLNEARIKGLTGGDAITARYMRQDEFTFKPNLKLWLAVNHKPVVKDDSRGFWRRMHLLPFTQSFPIDKTLDATLAAELPGVLAWAVRGCLEWQRQGLGTAQAISDATSEYRADSDPLTAFLAECCVTGDHLIARAGDLYRAYTTWATEEGQREKELLSSTTFGRRIGERFPRHRGNTGKHYEGVGLSSAWQDRQQGVRFSA